MPENALRGAEAMNFIEAHTSPQFFQEFKASLDKRIDEVNTAMQGAIYVLTLNTELQKVKFGEVERTGYIFAVGYIPQSTSNSDDMMLERVFLEVDPSNQDRIQRIFTIYDNGH